MFRARLLEFGIFGLAVLVLAGSVAVGIQVSLWLGILVYIIAGSALLFLIHNHDGWIIRKLTTPDQPMALMLCKTGFVGRARQFLRWLPSDPRCHLCLVPFGGFGRIIGIKPSAQNPNFCRSCFEGFPTKMHELEVGVLFADIRGFTSWSEHHQTAESAETLRRFYAIANGVLTKEDAIVNYIGDQVMALYVVMTPSFGERTAQIMLDSALNLIAAVREADNTLPVGIGINLGVAQVGNIAMGEGKGFTAIGDTVNTAARLQASAGEFEVLVSQSAFTAIKECALEPEKTSLILKGKNEPQIAYRFSI